MLSTNPVRADVGIIHVVVDRLFTAMKWHRRLVGSTASLFYTLPKR